MGFSNNKCDFCGYPYKSSLIANIPVCCDEALQEWLSQNTTASQDGDQVCILFGADLQEGFAGFGDNKHDATDNFIEEAEKHIHLTKPPINYFTLC